VVLQPDPHDQYASPAKSCNGRAQAVLLEAARNLGTTGTEETQFKFVATRKKNASTTQEQNLVQILVKKLGSPGQYHAR
jgi:hypothetical protein